MTAPAAPTPVLRQLLSRHRRGLVASTALFVSHQAGEALVPVVAGIVIDRAVVTGDGGALVRWLLVLAVVFAALSTSWRWGDRIFTRNVERAGHDLRLRIAERATAHRGTADRTGAGEVVSVASSDVEAALGVHEAVAAGLAGLVGILVAAVTLLVIEPVLGLLVLLGMPPVLLLLQVLVGPIERRFSAQQADVARAASTATDLLRGLRVVKGLHIEANAAARYRQASRSSLTASLRATRLHAAQQGLTTVVTGGFVAVIALVGGHLAADGRISIGALVAAVGVTQFLVGPIGRMGWAVAELGTARASAARVATVLDAPAAVAEADPPATALPTPPAAHPAPADDAAGAGARAGAVSLVAVRHGALAGFELAVAAGTFVGVAASEAEAGTLVELLARSTDPDGGSLHVGGEAYPAIPLDRLRRTVLVAEHEAPLFTGTVTDNLLVAARARGTDVTLDPDGEHLGATLAAVAADEVADALPQGLDTPVTERGLSLSGGQRQRIALARALLLEPTVLVLHDPTTAIDSVTEAQIAAGLRQTRSGRTTIVLTTSPALLAAADVVVHVSDGAVADVGRHDELVDRNPAYAQAVLT